METSLKREIARKILHMAMGLFALTLRWLTPWQAILCAMAAIAHNLWLFPHYGMKKLERPEEKERGYSGMIGYPAVVLILLVMSTLILFNWLDFSDWGRVVFHNGNGGYLALAVTAGAWAIMAFGDAFAAIGGLLLKGPSLPWNEGKRWTGFASFLIAGTLFSTVWMAFVLEGYWFVNKDTFLFFLPVCFVAAFAAAIVESLPGQIDDNLTVPVVAWMVLSFPYLHYLPIGYVREFIAHGLASHYLTQALILIALNFAIAGIALFLGWVDRNGFIIGSLIGLSVLFGMGWRGYALLVLFYAVSHFSTYYGKKKKEKLGIAEEHGGKRLAGSVFSKGFIPALVAWLSPEAFTIVLAIYAADTVATEFGKTDSGNTFTLPRFKKVAAGTPGGMSFKGTLSGVIAILLFSGAFCFLIPIDPLFSHNFGLPSPSDMLNPLSIYLGQAYLPMLIITIALLWFLAESAINSLNARFRLFSKPVIHVMVGVAAVINIELIAGFIVVVTNFGFWLRNILLGHWLRG